MSACLSVFVCLSFCLSAALCTSICPPIHFTHLFPPACLQPQAASCQRTSVPVGSSWKSMQGVGLRTSSRAWSTLTASWRSGLLVPPASSKSTLAASYSVTTQLLISTPTHTLAITLCILVYVYVCTYCTRTYAHTYLTCAHTHALLLKRTNTLTYTNSCPRYVHTIEDKQQVFIHLQMQTDHMHMHTPWLSTIDSSHCCPTPHVLTLDSAHLSTRP